MSQTNKPQKTEFTDNKLDDSPADRDIWDKLLGTEESDKALEEMIDQASKEAEKGNLSPMDGDD